ncbi:MAG: LLM class flavin-dependent oxidoreductase [Actinomycetota bacterium]|nr:LLM class flavin-dependent oxidoreductase [Actinomycetota bacterium]
MVNGIHHRHPAITANMASTLDIVSNGRLILGLGAGWNEEESSAYGLRLGPLGERFDRFDEALIVIRRLLADEWTDFDGEHFTITHARNEPKGPQQPLPICIGGTGPKRTLRAVAHHAQQWDAGGWDRPMWEQRSEVLAGHCAAIGRDPAEIRRSVHTYVDPDTDLARTRDEVADLADAGVDVAIIALRPPHHPAILERAVDAVLPVI